ncbi:TetR/AcrR family transcriptional regulator [Mycolicibacterium obuense]|uniref:TetR/AcrR family transcriptional regulator n=1 Tax=Mycolicibacterium obuense TaxID=1807 RepID=UPI00093B230D|nr:TetR/AcrR family transcriptional regulator [Mycolicibacterium obuense]OKH72677.1 TetR family transcriptional regulator [Mycobacterium sp. SWH-M1]
MAVDSEARSSGRSTQRPQPRGEERRSRLLAALAHRLDRQSLAEVSVADVASEAGLARSAFYFYFSSKNEAVTHLLAGIFDTQISDAAEVFGRDGDARENLSQVLLHTVESWVAQRSSFLAMLDARDADADTRVIWESWLTRYEDFVAAYIDEHSVRAAGCASRDLAHSLLSLNERVLERFLRGNGLDTADDVHRSLTHVWTSAIFGSAP